MTEVQDLGRHIPGHIDSCREAGAAIRVRATTTFERHVDPGDREYGTPAERAPLRVASGCTDGRRVWLDEHLTDVEARCALTHELVHMSRGLTPGTSPRQRRTTCERRPRGCSCRGEVITAHVGSQLDQRHLAQELG
ncbi:hypothetical protein QJS66_02250 [Kocuria rhizophila]|nr:hypothetical protein QJS66_02250 [Kocuria rhizophila]